MGKPYSQDLRERVIAAMDDGGDAYELAPLFRVSVSYIYKVLGRRRRTGETTARSQRHGPLPRLAPYDEVLRARVGTVPDATLADQAALLALPREEVAVPDVEIVRRHRDLADALSATGPTRGPAVVTIF